MHRLSLPKRLLLVLLFTGASTVFAKPARPIAATQAAPGAAISYRLPTDGPLPRTYRVTLAITDPKNPDWLVSTFAAGVVRTVTAENQGRFTETWNGLDDNFMPVPPGDYGVKGIYMLAERWSVDGQYHTIVPHFVTGASSFQPPDELKPEPFGGDPVDSPLGDVAVSPDGIAVFYYQYLENGRNNPMIDLNKPVGYDQFVRSFMSGGAAGGTSTTTDGQNVWSFSTDGGRKFIYRADGKRFGTGKGNARLDLSYPPEGWVTAMANWVDPQSTKKTFVYAAERGKIVAGPGARPQYSESATERVDTITVLDGESGAVLSHIAAPGPMGLATGGDALYILQTDGGGGGFAVARAPIRNGLPAQTPQKLFKVPSETKPGGLAVDGHGNIYVSDGAANQVCRFNAAGQLTLRFGKGGSQKPGSYDPQILMNPGKIAAWTDKDGHDRLLILEHAGPNRISEWNAADGTLLRDWLSLQTHANHGYAIDPEHPEQLYMMGQQNWLLRFKVDYGTKRWTVDAVWPDVGNDPMSPHLVFPRLIRVHGNLYLAGERTFNIYRLAGDRWLLSAGLIAQRSTKGQPKYYFWHDENGNGKVDESEYKDTPTDLPVGVWKYWGQRWLDDLSLAAVPQGSDTVWRLPVSGFDAHGNPIFTQWQKLLTDSVFAARKLNAADAVHGGNEMDEVFGSAWSQIDGRMSDGFYVSARGSKGFTANFGAQQKLSRYVPDGKGGYVMRWRTGRAALGDVAQEGEIYGAIHVRRPINGLVSVIDQTRCGVVLYTEDGLYVDTLFPDSKRFSRSSVGIYALPGEFFAGDVFPNRENGRIYFAFGKYTPLLFEAVGWSTKENPVRPLPEVQSKVSISGGQIAAPPDIALFFRGGAGTAHLARIAPAVGGAAMDGSLTGWESASPNTFQADDEQSVEARCLYDPQHLYIRWHVRLAGKFEPKPLAPIERIFTHDRMADTVSLYLQGDVNAKPGPAIGRPGDARIVFGIFEDGGKLTPAALGMYPAWPDAATAHPMQYTTPVGTASFAHVAPVAGAELAYAIDPDQKGFVIVAALPASAFPQLPAMRGGLRTFIDFDATLNGHNKFWWASSDGSASRETYDEPTEARLYPSAWAPVQFQGFDRGLTVQHWMVCGPFGGPGAEKFNADGGPSKEATRKFYDAAQYPPDAGVDVKAVYSGPQIQGYWPKANEIRWKAATAEDLDTRVKLGSGAQVWYAATWICAPQDLSIECSFRTSRMVTPHYFLNGADVTPAKFVEASGETGVLKADRSIDLHKGWNEVRFRGYCYGYPPLHAGLVLLGPQEQLWRLRLSGKPPIQNEPAPRK